MREGCGEPGLLDFRISILDLLCLASLPARTGKKRNRIWSQNEDCGGHPLLCRTLRSFQWARRPADQSRGSSVCWPGDRSTGAGVRSFRSVRPCTIQRDRERVEGHCPSFFSLRRLVTLLQSAARAAANRKSTL